MADKTKIEWTRGADGAPGATWNIITGCDMVDAGCTNCYAMQLAGSRLRHHPSRAGLTRVTGGRAKWTGEVRFNEGWLDQPLRWTRPRRIFVCAHGDLFHPAVPDEWIDRVFAVMALCPQHTFQVLTKRPERAREYLRKNPGIRIRSQMPKIGGPQPVIQMNWPLPNVWLGTSISDQASADLRVPHLLAAPAAVRFLSAEPLLGQVDLTRWIGSRPYIGASTYGGPDGLRRCDLSGNTGLLDWVIVGGESGAHARPMHPDWARSLRDQCVAAGVAFFFKQWGEWGPSSPEEAAGNPHSGWRCLAGHPHVPRREELYPEAGAAFIERKGKARAGRLLDGRIWDQMPGAQHG